MTIWERLGLVIFVFGVFAVFHFESRADTAKQVVSLATMMCGACIFIYGGKI